METSTATPPVTQRATVSGVAVTLGMATITVDWVSAGTPNKDKAGSFHSLCHECEEPGRLHQVLGCEHGHGPFENDDIVRRGKELPDGTLVDVTDAEIAAVRGVSVEEAAGKVMNLVPVRTAQLMEHTLPGDVVYRLRPPKKGATPGGYDLLRLLVTKALRSGRTLVGEMPVRGGAPKFFWLSIRKGQVVAQALLRPDDIAPFDEIPATELPEQIEGMAVELLDRLTVDFDPQSWRNQVRERALALIAAKAAEVSGGATVTPIGKSKGAGEVVDLEAVLSAMLQTA